MVHRNLEIPLSHTNDRSPGKLINLNWLFSIKFKEAKRSATSGSCSKFILVQAAVCDINFGYHWCQLSILRTNIFLITEINWMYSIKLSNNQYSATKTKMLPNRCYPLTIFYLQISDYFDVEKMDAKFLIIFVTLI